MYNLGKDEAISLEDERFTECRAVKLYYAIYGRNAWHDTWITRYFDGCMNQSFEAAKQTIEPRRVQGSVFYIAELPALQFINSKLSVIITEINSEKPLQRHQDIPEGLAVTLCEIFDYFDPLTNNSVIRLMLKKRLSRNFFESIKGGSPLKQYRSQGADYPLGWQEDNDYSMSSTAVEQLASNFDVLIPPFETPNMDKPVGKLGLSLRTAQTLKNAQITTLRELMSFSEKELIRKQNMGRKSVYEIIDALSNLGQQLPE